MTVCLVYVFAGYSEVDTVPSAKLILINQPSSVDYYVNGLQRFPDENDAIDITPGEILLEIKRKRVVVYSAFFSVDPNENREIEFNCDQECALFHVVTEPSGATLSMDGRILGYTPYMNRFIKPGSYSIMATLPGYIPIIRRISLSMESQIQMYEMEMSQVAKDSLESARRSLKKRRKKKITSALALLGVGMAAAGAYYDYKGFTYLRKMEEAAEAYDAAKTIAEVDRQKKNYYAEREKIKKPLDYRNIFYSVAGGAFLSSIVILVF